MKIKGPACAALVAVLLLGSSAVFAHHSPSQYDTSKTTTVIGTVTEFQWMNPHAEIKMTVKDDGGNSEEWSIECPPPNLLHRAGWTKDSIKAGDQITVSGNAAKNGHKVIRSEKVVLPNGQVLNQRQD
jgi:hypothetical protein